MSVKKNKHATFILSQLNYTRTEYCITDLQYVCYSAITIKMPTGIFSNPIHDFGCTLSAKMINSCSHNSMFSKFKHLASNCCCQLPKTTQHSVFDSISIHNIKLSILFYTLNFPQTISQAPLWWYQRCDSVSVCVCVCVCVCVGWYPSHPKWPCILIILCSQALQSKLWDGRVEMTKWCLISHWLLLWLIRTCTLLARANIVNIFTRVGRGEPLKSSSEEDAEFPVM